MTTRVLDDENIEGVEGLEEEAKIEGVEPDKDESIEDKDELIEDQHQEVMDDPPNCRSSRPTKPVERLSPQMEGKYHLLQTESTIEDENNALARVLVTLITELNNRIDKTEESLGSSLITTYSLVKGIKIWSKRRKGS